MMPDEKDRQATERVSLIGGDLALRTEKARVGPIDSPFVYAPYRRPADLEPAQAFIAHRPLHIEIGFARGHHLFGLAAQHPDAHILGFEIKRQWVRRAANQAARESVSHVRVIEGDARPYLERLVPDDAVAGLHIMFPDPWWKKRHHKRRVFNADFLAEMIRVLAPDGSLITKTDVPAYVDLILDEADAAGLKLVGQGPEDPLLGLSPKSHREKKCLEFGVPFQMLRFQK